MKVDPALAAKLAALLKKVAHGKALAVAAAEVGLGAGEVDRILKDLERELWARARAADAPAAADPHTKATAPEPPIARRATRGTRREVEGLSLVAYADGGSRGNPGKAACAAVITDARGDELLRRARLLGKKTNNVAEYQGVLLALTLCRELGAAAVTLKLDSELVVRQLEGRYKVKNADLAKLHEQVREAAREFRSFQVEHVPRAENKVADQIVNAALDGKDVDLG